MEKQKVQFIDEETRSLFQLGWIVPLDGLFLVLELLGGFIAIMWFFLKRPDIIYVLAIFMAMSMTLSVWLITLVYRSCYFTLKMRAVMETMPEQAGKIAFELYSQKVADASKGEKMRPL